MEKFESLTHEVGIIVDSMVEDFTNRIQTSKKSDLDKEQEQEGNKIRIAVKMDIDL